jgi:thymidylate synthase ThyX
MTANARVIELMIRKMLSHPLLEVREIGEKVKEVSIAETPTLVKYADVNPYLVETTKELENWESKNGKRESDWCKLIDYDKDGENKILAAALYRFNETPYQDALLYVRGLKEKESLAETLLGKLDKFDVPLRELEYSSYTFDLIMDQGAYAEFKRHRMMSQTPQRLTARLGYTIPRLVTEAPFGDGTSFGSKYEAAMESAIKMYEKLHAFNPDVAQYVVPNGFNRRVLAQFNLREAFAFCQLRSAVNAHFSIRRVAQKIYEEIFQVHPLLAKYMKRYDETWQQVEETHFTKI